ncbi:MAG: iron chaperone [Ignavibacteria bacterium]
MNKPVKDIDAYISNQTDDIKAKLSKIRLTIKTTVPEAVEVISYQMPAYKYNGILAYFAAFKNHYSLFLSPKIIVAFSSELKAYETSKGTIKIPNDKPVPVLLVTKIIKAAAKQNLEKAKMKKGRSGKK